MHILESLISSDFLQTELLAGHFFFIKTLTSIVLLGRRACPQEVDLG
jgi:hypothetical protein